MGGVSIFGDSISTFLGMIPPINNWFYDAFDTNHTGVAEPGQTWWMQVIERLGGHLVSNASFSGAMVEGPGFPAGESMERASQVIGPGGEVPHDVIVFMGINDYGWGSWEAQAAGGSQSSPLRYGRYAGVANADPEAAAPGDAVQRFQGAYERTLSNIKSVAPDSTIYCMTLSPARILGTPGHFCYSLRGIHLDKYNDAIRRSCANSGARCVDIRSLGLDYSSIDGTHPDLLGMRQLADLFMAAMGDEGALDGYDPDMESLFIGDDPIASNDRKSLITPSSWNCYFRDE